MDNILITQKDIVTTKTIKSISIDSGQISLNSSAKFPVKLLGDDNSVIGIEFVEISGVDYENWGSSDDYITDFILDKLGLTKA